MSEYRISYNMDTCDIMNSLFESERVGFVYECYDCLSVEQQKDFIETLDADEIVEYLGDEVLIEELESRGYKI
jgi:hypothetical protein